MEEVVQEALGKGIELHQNGELVLAKQLYNSVLQLDPKHATANHNLGVIEVDTGNIAASLSFLRNALEASPEEGQHWISYIDALLRMDSLDDARRMFAQAKEMGAEDAAFDELEQRLTISSAKDGNLSVEKPTRADLESLVNLYSQGQLQEAIDWAQVLVKKFSNSAVIYNIQGAAYAGLKLSLIHISEPTRPY